MSTRRAYPEVRMIPRWRRVLDAPADRCRPDLLDIRHRPVQQRERGGAGISPGFAKLPRILRLLPSISLHVVWLSQLPLGVLSHLPGISSVRFQMEQAQHQIEDPAWDLDLPLSLPTATEMRRLCQQMLYSIAACIFVADCTRTTSVQIIEAGLIHPQSISVSPQGAIYVADDDGRLFPERGWLYAVSPKDGAKAIELGDLIPWSIATDAQRNIYATMMPLLDKGIYKIDPRTGPT